MNAKERLLAKLAAAKAAASATEKDGVKDEPVTGNTSNVSSSNGVSKESGKNSGPGETESETQSKGCTNSVSTVQTDSSSGTEKRTSSSVVQLQHPLAMKLQELEQALQAKVAIPEFPYLLKHIHDSLKNDPEIVTILSDEEKGLIVQGLTKHRDVTIIAAPKKAGKKSQPISLDMLD